MSFSGLIPIRMQMALKIDTAKLTKYQLIYIGLYNKELINWTETLLKRDALALIND